MDSESRNGSEIVIFENLKYQQFKDELQNDELDNFNLPIVLTIEEQSYEEEHAMIEESEVSDSLSFVSLEQQNATLPEDCLGDHFPDSLQIQNESEGQAITTVPEIQIEEQHAGEQLQLQ